MMPAAHRLYCRFARLLRWPAAAAFSASAGHARSRFRLKPIAHSIISADCRAGPGRRAGQFCAPRRRSSGRFHLPGKFRRWLQAGSLHPWPGVAGPAGMAVVTAPRTAPFADFAPQAPGARVGSGLLIAFRRFAGFRCPLRLYRVMASVNI